MAGTRRTNSSRGGVADDPANGCSNGRSAVLGRRGVVFQSSIDEDQS